MVIYILFFSPPPQNVGTPEQDEADAGALPNPVFQANLTQSARIAN